MFTLNLRRFILGLLLMTGSGANLFSQDETLRMVSVNVWSGLDYRGFLRFGEFETGDRRETRFRILVTQLRELQPDVVFLQEANPVASFAARLADSLEFDEVHQVVNAGLKIGPVGPPLNFKEGLAVLARRELRLEKVDVWKLGGGLGLHGDIVSLHTDENTYALCARILIGNKPMHLVNVHLVAGPSNGERLGEAMTKLQGTFPFDDEALRTGINDRIERRYDEFRGLLERLSCLPAGRPVIVGGDLNAPIDAFRDLMAESGYFPASSDNTPTWDPERNENIRFSTNFIDAERDSLDAFGRLAALYDAHPQRLDHVLLSGHFTVDDVLETRIVFDEAVDGVHMSDHYGILTIVRTSRATAGLPAETGTVPELSDATIEPLPIVMYDTDIGFGFGGKSFFLNTFGMKESIDALLFWSTKDERWVRAVYSMPDFDLRQGREYPCAVDVLVDYDRYGKFMFFGIGDRSSFEQREHYVKTLFETSLLFSRGFSKSFIGQAGVRYRSISNTNVRPDGLLAALDDSHATGTVQSAGVVLAVRYDTRDSFVNPSRGIVLETEAEAKPGLFSTERHLTATGWFRGYTILWYPQTVLAVRAGMKCVLGNNIPIQLLPGLGGNQTLRGAPQDRYLDRIFGLVNAELRFPLYWRFGAIVGADAGAVWSSPERISLKGWTVSPVVGLRFYMDTFVIRADLGFGHETTGFYFNFGHVF